MNENNYYNPNQQPNQPMYSAPQQNQGYNQQVYNNPYSQQNFNQPKPPVYPQYNQAKDTTKDVMSVGQYLLVFFVSMIPVVNIIMWIVWLVSPNTNKNKKNYIIANIVWALIYIALICIAFGVLTAVGVNILDELSSFPM